MFLTGYYAKSIISFLTGNMLFKQKCKWHTKLIEQYFCMTYPVEPISFFPQDRKCVSTFRQKDS